MSRYIVLMTACLLSSASSLIVWAGESSSSLVQAEPPIQVQSMIFPIGVAFPPDNFSSSEEESYLKLRIEFSGKYIEFEIHSPLQINFENINDIEFEAVDYSTLNGITQFTLISDGTILGPITVSTNFPDIPRDEEEDGIEYAASRLLAYYYLCLGHNKGADCVPFRINSN